MKYNATESKAETRKQKTMASKKAQKVCTVSAFLEAWAMKRTRAA